MKKFVINLFIIIFATAALCLAIYFYNLNYPASENMEGETFVISKGEGVKSISFNLYDRKIIKSKLFFEIYVWSKNKEADFLAGEYALKPGLNIKEVTDLLTSGYTVSRERNIKIIEGWKISDINQYLIKERVITDNNFIDLAGRKISDWRLNVQKPEFLNDVPAKASFEGFLFPDTYRIFKDAQAEEIIFKMLDNFGKKLTQAMRDDIKKQGRTIYDVITLASVVEKEVKKPEDMKIVAGIFTNRIKNGQALESCATLAYILGVNKVQYSQEDTMIDSPYNTYKNMGLPPGPIANPGLAAITAAIYPSATDYNYFLSRSDNGETVFSKTYEEHLRNKNKYLK